MAQEPPSSLLTDFTEADAAEAWVAVNDDVMGGRSTGGAAFTGTTLVFTGATDTDGGGFASLRADLGGTPLGGYAGVALRVRGDGRTYAFQVRTGERAGRLPVSYRAAFGTMPGEDWHVVRLPFADFRASARGRALPDRRLDPARVRQIGLFLYDGRDGPFRLEVDQIRTFRPT